MKNTIKYYYNMDIDKLEPNNDGYYFEWNNSSYLFYITYDNEQTINKIIMILEKSFIKYHLPVLNRNNSIITNINGINYVLLKIRSEEKSLTTISLNTEKIKNWAKQWEERMDYYETQINEVVKDSTIKYYIQYFIGITENAIAKYNNKIYNNENYVCGIVHKKINTTTDMYSYYNPLNMTIDIKIREYAEYIKYEYFSNNLSIDEIIKKVNDYKLKQVDINPFLIRLEYPSYFFDYFDEYVETGTINKNMYLIIKKSNSYELLINQIANIIKKNYF